MKEPVLIIIKPDGICKGLVGNIFNKFSKLNLEIIALKAVVATRKLAQEHYIHLKDGPFFQQVVSFLVGEYHPCKQLIAIIFYGDNAITKCRKVAGTTNPEKAGPETIRGAYGRITAQGFFENVVHVSSDKVDTKREIQLWFEPDDILRVLFKTKIRQCKKRTWA